MPILHTVNKSPFEKDSLDACIAHALDGSAVLLIEDGVYAASSGTAVEPRVRDAMQRLNFFALASDCSARGLAEAELIDGIAAGRLRRLRGSGHRPRQRAIVAVT